MGLVVEPLAFAAAGDIHAGHAAMVSERPREEVEIAAVAREPVYAQHHVRTRRVAPVGIGDAVKGSVAKRLKKFLTHRTIINGGSPGVPHEKS